MSQNAIVLPASALRRIFVGLVVLILLMVVVLVARTQLFRFGVASAIDRETYQAVFIVGGQVFFGKLQELGDYFLLDDIFYLSVGSEEGAQGQLVKRGTELHRPTEPMIVPKNQVLFIENINPNGDVATAIRRFKAGELPAAAPPPITAAPRTPAPTTPAPTGPRPSPTR
jgi:hypothetical protein